MGVQVWLNGAEAVLDQGDAGPELTLTLQRCGLPSSGRSGQSVGRRSSVASSARCSVIHSILEGSGVEQYDPCRNHERPLDAFVVTDTNQRHSLFLRGVDGSVAAATALRKAASLIPSAQQQAAGVPPPSGSGGSGSVRPPAQPPAAAVSTLRPGRWRSRRSISCLQGLRRWSAGLCPCKQTPNQGLKPFVPGGPCGVAGPCGVGTGL